MPNGIVPESMPIETCLVLECNLTDKDVEQFVEELDCYTKLYDPAFRRREQWRRGQVYL
jgi:hypothetical protein